MPPSVEHDPDDPAAGFEREVALLRAVATEPVTFEAPPADLWARIERDLDPAPDVIEPAPPTVLDERRRARAGTSWRWLAAVAAVVVLALAAVVVASGGEDGSTELASTELSPVNDVDLGSAQARVTLNEEGDALRLHVEMRDLPDPAGGTFYELWLLSDDGEPVSLATMEEGGPSVSTDIDVPAGIDTDRYRVVDVSIQVDGEGPEHSGNSVLRGNLTA